MRQIVIAICRGDEEPDQMAIDALRRIGHVVVVVRSGEPIASLSAKWNAALHEAALASDKPMPEGN